MIDGVVAATTAGAVGAVAPDLAVARTFATVAAVIVAARGIGLLFRLAGQPQLIGELVAGICLGPSLFGVIAPDAAAWLFPRELQPGLRVLAQLGVIIFMFIVGMEVDVGMVRTVGRRAIFTSLSSITVPFVLGVFVLAPLLRNAYDRDVSPTAFSMFVGVSICGSAFAILARLLAERKLFRLPLGSLLVGCAVVDDIVVWAILSVTLAVADVGGGDQNVVVVMAELLGIHAIMLLVGRPLLERTVVAWFRKESKLSPDGLAIVLIGLLLSSFATRYIGLSELLGAFLFGTVLPRRDTSELFGQVLGRLENVSVLLLLPIFFAVTGQQVRLNDLGGSDLGWFALILLVASVGKFLGGGLAAYFQGVSARQSMAVGALLNTRGLAELVVLRIALDAGVLDERLFTMFVGASILTTVLAGPLLRLVYPPAVVERDIADMERARLAGEGGYRALVIIEDVADGDAVVDAAIGLAGASARGEVLMTRFTPSRLEQGAELGSGITADLASFSSAMAGLQALRRRIEGAGLRCVVTTRFSDDIPRDVLAQVAAASPDVVVVGAPSGSDLAGRQLLEHLFDNEQADVAVVAGAPSFGAGVMVSALGGRDGGAVVEAAARLARTNGSPLLLAGAASGLSGGRLLAAARRDLEAAAVAYRVVEDGSGDGAGAGAGAATVGTVSAVGDRQVAALAGEAPALLVRGRRGERVPLATQLARANAASGAGSAPHAQLAGEA